MSHSQFHRIDCLYLDMHGLIFETSIYYWQNQPGNYLLLPEGSVTPEGVRVVT